MSTEDVDALRPDKREFLHRERLVGEAAADPIKRRQVAMLDLTRAASDLETGKRQEQLALRSLASVRERLVALQEEYNVVFAVLQRELPEVVDLSPKPVAETDA